MNMVGFCRFSMLGHGDWKAYRSGDARSWQEIARDVAEELFQPARMERRFEAFEHLFLPSMAGQTDGDFTMAVMSSTAMPAHYQDRLRDLCAATGNVRPYFFDPMSAIDAQGQVLADLGLKWSEVLQFRLDDDDCLFADFIKRTHRHAGNMARLAAFGISYPNTLVSVAYDGEHPVTWLRFAPFMSCGLVLRHPKKSVFTWVQHKKVPRHVVCVTDPQYYTYMTHRSDNDRERYDLEEPKRSELREIKPEMVRKIVASQYAFLKPRGREILGLAP